MNSEELLTTGEIAGRLGIPVHRVQYYLVSRRVDPIKRIGGYRLFSSSVLEKLRKEVKSKQGAAVAHAG